MWVFTQRMETLVTRKIIKLNSAIQCMTSENGPAGIEKAVHQLQKLLDQLRHIDDNQPRYLMAWNLLTHYGKIELRNVQFYHVYTEREVVSPVAQLHYDRAFTNLKELINTAISMLSLQ